MLTEERKAEIRQKFGKEIFSELYELLRKKQIIMAEYLESLEVWLTSKGYVKTNMGWLKRQQIYEMGLVKEGDRWVVGQKEQITRRIIGVGRNQREEIISESVPNEGIGRRQPQINLPYDERSANVRAIRGMSSAIADNLGADESI